MGVQHERAHVEQCGGCGVPRAGADYVERHEVVFAKGEFAGERGIIVLAECVCGITSVIPLSVDLGRAA